MARLIRSEAMHVRNKRIQGRMAPLAFLCCLITGAAQAASGQEDVGLRAQEDRIFLTDRLAHIYAERCKAEVIARAQQLDKYDESIDGMVQALWTG